jgi:hypothetical protein
MESFAGRLAAVRDAPPSSGPVPAIVCGAWRATICQRITDRRPSRLGRSATPSAGCSGRHLLSKTWRDRFECLEVGINFRFVFRRQFRTVEYGTKIYTPIVNESASLLKSFYRFFLSGSNAEEWQRRFLASTAIAQLNRNNAVEIKYEI